MKLSYLYPLLFTSILGSCQEPIKEVPEEILLETASEEELESVANFEFDTTRLKYAWQSDYNVEQALCNKIPPPPGYFRTTESKESYANWLRHLPLSKDPKVYYYDGAEKHWQGAQYAVIDIDVGNKDLQQCADAVMRLRAEYLYAYNNYESIHFNYTNGTNIPFNKWNKGYYPSVRGNKVQWTTSSKNNSTYASFRKYMTSIYMYAGTASLEKELNSISLNELQIGDVFIQGGHPGHAIIVVDVCEHPQTKEKCFMVAQSYMPAQSIHILQNFHNEEISPWYKVSECSSEVLTPEWTFSPNDLMRFSP